MQWGAHHTAGAHKVMLCIVFDAVNASEHLNIFVLKHSSQIAIRNTRDVTDCSLGLLAMLCLLVDAQTSSCLNSMRDPAQTRDLL